ncbi:CD2 antigen cytoplasmic tail-binding protein 2 homolog isoform X2 [Amyelois transitella]|uniref:CD2 antigen cytoplasmic tail-binding protein 2 homolog isoform X2 n=1 Tax=Amyelois transitella TaxID=680683 RepID=UPI00298F570E|nr:CD2 antigen cytoplasmic tail-binding protein 2 homolog isoform X2 [Amyelois transitella]
MAKRSASEAFEVEEIKVLREGKKHSLDSDEEDSGAEEEKKNILNINDIEGEEEGQGGIEGEITITPFNMKEELEEGHFDTQGHYHWKKEKEIRDGWLDNIDWVKVKGRPEDKYKVHKDDDNRGLGDESSSEDDEPQEKFELIANYKEIFQHMKPQETIAKTLQRLANSKISSAERWKRKKAGIVDEGSKTVTRITELANQILTKMGNMDIYQESYEKISKIISKDKSKNDDADLDMYADDFDQKEKETLSKDQGATENTEEDKDDEPKQVKWEFKWNQNDSEVSGPHSTEQMQKWSEDGYFKTGVWVRKHGEDSQFYNSSRMDFELYM